MDKCCKTILPKKIDNNMNVGSDQQRPFFTLHFQGLLEQDSDKKNGLVEKVRLITYKA